MHGYGIYATWGAYLGENQLVQKDMFLHIGKGDRSHDQKRSDHEALTPGLENEAIWTIRTRDSVRHVERPWQKEEQEQEEEEEEEQEGESRP